jgi:nucleoside-diphosphate kinase
MIEQTLVVIKPDGVERGLIGEIIRRFEHAGLKIVAMKMQWINKTFAEKHYTDDISKRRGEKVRNLLLDFITEGPVVGMVIEGIDAIVNVRRIVGDTEPKGAAPGTIRGDFAHVSFSYADHKSMAVRNLIHASANIKEAQAEVDLWFASQELHSYPLVHDKHTR